MNDDPQFTPRDGSPTIHVNIRTNREKEGEMGRLWSEHVEQTRLAEEKAAEAAAAAAVVIEADSDSVSNVSSGEDDEKYEEQKLVGEEKYDLSVKDNIT